MGNKKFSIGDCNVMIPAVALMLNKNPISLTENGLNSKIIKIAKERDVRLSENQFIAIPIEKITSITHDLMQEAGNPTAKVKNRAIKTPIIWRIR